MSKLCRTEAVLLLLWRPGQHWLIELLDERQKWIILGPSYRILILDRSVIAKRLHLPLSKIAAFLMVTYCIEDTNYLQISQMLYDYQDKRKHYQQEDKSLNQQEDTTTMATLDDLMKSKQYSIQDILRMKPGFIIPEVMTWCTGQNTTPKSSLSKQSCIQSMLYLIFFREPMNDSPQALIQRAISSNNVQTRRYSHLI
ncbi:MAG: hypothetical protein EZS28_002579 [Streblomastix strix]|uniref:Uncharacterized protein n=1 Tax=Streblomastix strix TaxID=222440 RepID=A0A5J4X5J1_9EUKA|nr:MAG: hypothetical protein EZS28_002579 [Streblomastix strix]